MVPSTALPGINMDEDWASNLVKSWQKKACWHQKWQPGDDTVLIIHSTIAPAPIQIVNTAGVIVNTMTWTNILTSTTNGSYFLATIQLDTGVAGPLPLGVYYVYCRVTNGGSYTWNAISEPIEVRNRWPVTTINSYTHSSNKPHLPFGAYPVVIKCRKEAQLLEFMPGSVDTDYANEMHDQTLLNSNTFRSWKLKLADTPGVPDYEADHWNRILSCDTVRHGITLGNPGKLITKESGAKWNVQRSPGYPLSGWDIDVTETVVDDAIGYQDVQILRPGIVVTFDQDEDLYGGDSGNNVHFLDVKNN